MMNEAVFISDLHLHPQEPEIKARFDGFLEWAAVSTRAVYILGDFFHVWVGDDGMDEFAMQIIQALEKLHQSGVEVYWMPGNRDFLIGQQFLHRAKLKYLADPSIIVLPGLRLMVTHGDAYCTHDYAHQILRILTRPAPCRNLILRLPMAIRRFLVTSVRNYSQNKKNIQNSLSKKYEIEQQKLFKVMLKYQVCQVIYGHIHRPGTRVTTWRHRKYFEYILSDWDAKPQIICYNIVKGMHFLNKFEVA